MKILYQLLISLGRAIQPVLLLLIRLGCGFAFLQTGWGKWHHIPNVASYFADLQIPLPMLNAYFIAGLELLGGLAIIIGLGSRLFALLLTLNMAVAYSTAHLEAVYSLSTIPSLFISATPFLFLCSSLLILAFGPGIFSLDALLKRFVWRIS